MKATTRLPLALRAPLVRPLLTRRPVAARLIHNNTSQPANVVPVYGTGPPPEPPVPAKDHVDSRVARRRRQAEMLRQAKDLRAAASTAAGAKKSGDRSGLLKKRFWQHVYVKEVDGTSLSSP